MKKPAKPTWQEQSVAITVSGSGSSYKKAVQHAIDSADTAYHKALYGPDCKYEDWENDDSVKYELKVLDHKITWSYERYSALDEPTHYVTCLGHVKLKRLV